ncbi:MAG: hypothetical protein K0S23_2317 [Fluviicola sp.]|jgi:hypothetical protein|uniref:hypothetical protein n=1 Tax=Fluviicola sp. TaxID=1917219 RepID=UPI00261C0283|nr:hypothetical protein [Fluviicola sp.]MDF3028010.1 hypothetical protein [Fluviicola sp.]
MRILIYIYIFAAVIFSFWSVIMETYPALFFIKLFAPEPGDKYPLGITGLVTILALLLPLVFVMFILKLIRNRKGDETNSVLDSDYFNKSGIHFMRIKQAQNRLISSPIFINGEQRGGIDSGKKLFIALDPGTYEVEVGAKREKSDKLIAQVQANSHAQVEIRIIPNGLRSKHVIEVV